MIHKTSSPFGERRLFATSAVLIMAICAVIGIAMVSSESYAYDTNYEVNVGGSITLETGLTQNEISMIKSGECILDVGFTGTYSETSCFSGSFSSDYSQVTISCKSSTAVGTSVGLYWCVEDPYDGAEYYNLYGYYGLTAVDPSIPVSSISISGSSSGEVGNTITLTATTYPSTADLRRVNWDIISGSSYASIASTTDSATGGTCKLSLNSAGTFVVRATAADDSGIYKDYTVTVTSTPVTVSSISITGPSSGYVGDTLTYTATVSPSNASDTGIYWSKEGSNLICATITDSVDTSTGGTCTLRLSYAGTITLVAEAEDGSGVVASKTVTIYPSDSAGYPTEGVTGGSGTENDPFIISMVGGQSYEIEIPVVGTFTSYRAIGSDITISGITFTTKNNGTVSTLPSSSSLSGGQLGTMTISGTPATNGTWDFYAYNPSSELYYTIEVTGVFNTFVLSFNANSGSGAPSAMNFTGSGSTYSATIPATIPSRSGFTFDGWATTSDGSVIYSPGDTIILSAGATTLYAKWTQITYTHRLYYSASGATDVPSDDSYTGTSATAHTFTISSLTPQKSGFVFLGWTTSSGSLSVEYQPENSISVPANGSRTLYAVWQSAELAITSTQSDITMKTGDGFNYKISTNVDGCTVSVSGASWLSVNGNVVSGTPTVAGTYDVTVTVSKSGGYTSNSQSFTITVYSSIGFTSEPGFDGIYAYVE